MPRPHFPKGPRYSALEKNILKYRAYEMVLILFNVEQLRGFVISSIRSTDKLLQSLHGAPPRLPEGVKRPDRKALQILVAEGIISKEEAQDLRKLVNYRNLVAHATERLTIDVNRRWSFRLHGLDEYQPEALEKLETLSEKIHKGMGSGFVLPLSYDGLMFEPAERAYKEEMSRLRKKIRKQWKTLKGEIDGINTEIRALPSGLLDRLEPGHPTQFSSNGTLSARGIQCCFSLYEGGASPLTVAYLMRISWRAAKRWRDRWESGPSDRD